MKRTKAQACLALAVCAIMVIAGSFTLFAEPRQATSVPLAFIPNAGQFDSGALYRAEAQGVAIWLTQQGAIYQFVRIMRSDASRTSDIEMTKSGIPSVSDLTYESHTMQLSFSGADLSRVRPDGSAGYTANYFLGADASKWITGVPVHSAVVYEEIYPDISLKFYGNGSALEYDLIVYPGGDPKSINIVVDGATSVEVTDDGQLLIATPFGTAVHKQPFVYQDQASGRNVVAASYRKLSDASIGVKIEGTYDHQSPLIVDPEITFSTYLGGTSYDEGWGVAVDPDGNIYVTGLTASTDFPTVPPAAPTAFPVNVFVSKISPDGSDLIYSTYIGGDDYDGATNLAVDNQGNVYLTGETKSLDFPAIAPLQLMHGGGSDAFVVKLNPDGNSLSYASYLGGEGYELGRAIAVNSKGEACVVGHTCSPDFPVVNAIQDEYGGEAPGFDHCGDVFVTKVAAAGGAMEFSTFVGGTGYDEGWGVAVDKDDNIYAVGLTASADFPTQNPLYAHAVLADAFLTKLAPDGSAYVFSTYLGGNNYDGATSVAVDRFGRACVTGETKSSDFPHLNATQPLPGGFSDAFVTKFEVSGASVIYSTNIGGSGSELGWDIAVDEFGGATLAGRTASSNYPLQSPLKGELTGFYDAIVTRVAPSGHDLTFSSYYGGSYEEDARSVAIHNGTSVLVAGATISEDIPVVNAIQDVYGGGQLVFPRGDAYVASLLVTYTCGDMDGSGVVNIGDVVILLNYIFAGGPAPLDSGGGDVNCDGRPTISDAVYMINYIFVSGPAPCSGCE